MTKGLFTENLYYIDCKVKSKKKRSKKLLKIVFIILDYYYLLFVKLVSFF